MVNPGSFKVEQGQDSPRQGHVEFRGSSHEHHNRLFNAKVKAKIYLCTLYVHSGATNTMETS